MNGGTAASLDDSLYPNWLPTGVWQGLFSGNYNDELNSQGNDGSYWSSTAYGTGYAFDLGFADGYVYPGDGGYKYVGYAVRCLI